jgi:hypothetical protein
MEPVEDSSWSSYAHTILHFPGSLRIDLREPLTDAIRQALETLSVSPYFAVISAANTKGMNAADRVNEESASVLKREIEQRDYSYVAVRGQSADGEHREPGFAVFVHFEEARALAIASDQSAFFWYDGSTFWLMGALVDSPAIRLPQR